MDPRPVDIVLRDGSTVRVRAVEPADAPALVAFLEGLSPDSRYFRFFSLGVDLERIARDAADPPDGMTALVALHGTRVVALAQLARMDQERAEVAFASADDMAGRGLATSLLAHLAQLARAQGLTTLRATVMEGNFRMAGVFRHSGFPFKTRHTEEGLVFEAPAELSAEAVASFEERMGVATAASVGLVLRPVSVAVAGDGALLDRLRASGFAGRVGRLGEESDPVDLVVVSLPPDEACDAARAARRLGARAIVVLSEGFAERGPEGAAAQRRLVDACRAGGMRLVGPNCLGVVNTAEDVALNATSGAPMPARGRTALMTQSGALGLALLERAAELGVGISSFVSAGNKADLSGNDFLQYWEHDDDTGVVLLHLESFGNPRNFARIARRVAARKPIVAVKSGRTPAGARVVASHTGALLAAADVTVDALFRQAGVLRVGTVGDLLEVAAVLERAPLPAGPRVAIVANAGGPAVLCADACEAAGLEVPEPSVALRAPVDADRYADAVRDIADRDAADAVIAIASRVPGAGGAIVAAGVDLPVLLVTLSRDVDPVLPTYRFPENAARALARAAGYARWLREPREDPVLPDGVRVDDAAGLLAEVAVAQPRWLGAEDAARLCADYGIGIAEESSGGGAEVVVGMTLDPSFGPVVAVGAHGDVEVRLTPVTPREAAAAVAGLRLDGLDAGALADLVARVAALAHIHSEVVEIDLDPVVVLPRGVAAREPRIKVAAASPEPMWPAVGVSPPRR